MNQLDRLEALAQRVIEGTFGRLSGADPRETSPEEAPPTKTKEVLRLATDNEAARQWLLQTQDRRLPLGEPVINIGRALDNDIVLSEPTVSRYHAQLRWRQGRYYLCPPQQAGEVVFGDVTQAMTQSSPHTLVNDRATLAEQSPLNPGDVLTFGKTSLMIELDSHLNKPAE